MGKKPKNMGKKPRREKMKKEIKPYCIWLTGMPNSGKSTITYHLLQKELRNCLVIDGDKFRERVNPELSFSRKDILENNRIAIKVIKYLMKQGFNVLVAMITPYQETRNHAKKNINNYIEIYVKCPENKRSKRPNFKKSSIKFETPQQPNIIVNTDQETIQESVDKILSFLRKKRRQNETT